jgi:DnaJ homolog subfamily C member 19
MLKFVLFLGLIALAILWWRGGQQRRRNWMPADEARALLGVSPTDDAEAIRAAHRRLIAKVHPDQGGTPELARRTNMARDVLLAELSRTRES